MRKMTTTTHRRPNGSARRTIAAHVDGDAVAKLDLLVERGVFVNRSHAIDAAVALLLREYADLLGKEVCNADELLVGQGSGHAGRSS